MLTVLDMAEPRQNKTDPPSKKRVWGSRVPSRYRIRKSAPQPIETRLEIRIDLGKLASGRCVYNNADQLLSENGNTYEYDLNGNLISKTDASGTTTYTWDYEDRLVQVTSPTGTITYEYDADGNRVSSTTSAGTTKYLVDTNRSLAQVLAEYTPEDVLLASYTYADDLISMTRGGETRWYHFDGLGSTRLLTDATGAVTDSYDFEAFGGLIAQSGATANDFLFTGQQYDPNIGFYYLRARYYQPEQGRFLSTDLVDGVPYDPPSLHKYLYCKNDSVNRTDPSGLFSLTQLVVTTAIIGSLAGASVGYYLKGKTGAIIGGGVGAVVGAYAGYTYALQIFYYAPAVIAAAQRWLAPTQRFVRGPRGRVLLDTLDKLPRTNMVELYSNVRGAMDYARTVHASNLRALAEAGGRATYETVVFRIPQAVLDELFRVGALEIKITMEAGVTGVEYLFTAEGAAYLSRFVL